MNDGYKIHFDQEESKFFVMHNGRRLQKFPQFKALQTYLKNKGINRYELTEQAFDAARAQGFRG